MNKKGGLSVRARPASKVKKKPPGFLNLPGELRNQIYDYYFQQGFKCEFAEKDAKLGRKQRDSLKFFMRKLNSCDVQASCEKRFAPIATVYAESIRFLYENTTFAFDSPNRIVSFLNIPLATNLAHVTRIQLYYRVYGDPKRTEDIRWKQKHRDSWSRTCKAAAKQLVNLQHVNIWICTRETSVRLDLHEPWLKPMCWFRKRLDPRKTLAKALKTANVRIDTMWNRQGVFTDKRLQWASEHLHELFEEAISSMILGATVEVAMKDFNHAWDNQYVQWHHHLQFARTGW
ncbi:uncharacterized protein N0V89_012361 [Didymosphaeria variabile]|uniref:DUF7730 domain-containing protein n=1 Tax=Didymosphaeria variabile TaxID=1932322 RepID=A0A9W8XAC8_9PLEO|nr:uncharacterized protein N0V89_012361 [Didymosphaeria variabile]KAJ4344617.1 hypothetical protein N0V89_012361 [Didymosphaeria variabile]